VDHYRVPFAIAGHALNLGASFCSVYALCVWGLLSFGQSLSQEFLPAPPARSRLIYVLDQQNQLMSLPFEKAETPLRPAEIARSTRPVTSSERRALGDGLAGQHANFPFLRLIMGARILRCSSG
jgi:hypothetical protein